MCFRSIFRRRAGSYDVCGVQAHVNGQGQRGTLDQNIVVPKTRSPLKRFAYSILEKLERLKYKPVSQEDHFHLTLYEEGLLQTGTFYGCLSLYSKGTDTYLTVYPFENRPVLNICYGFRNDELAEGRNPKYRVSNIPTHVNRVRDAIYRVLYRDDSEDEANLYGFGIFEWLQTLEPAFEYLKTSSNRRRNKCVWTKRQTKPIIPASNHWPLIGDSSLMHNQWGPFLPHQNRLFEMFTVRISELGERHRMGRHVRVTDPVIATENTSRAGNRSRSRLSRALQDARRSESDVHQTGANTNVVPAVPAPGPNPAPAPGLAAVAATPVHQELLPGHVHVEEFLFRRQVAPRLGRFVFH